MACAIIFPWEFVAAFRNIILSTRINYAVIAQFGWAVIDFLIIYQLLFKVRVYEKKKRKHYILLVVTMTLLMFGIFSIPGGMFFTSYFNTIIGIMVWAAHTAKPQYPRTKLNLIVLLTKLLSDFLGLIAYFDFSTAGTIMSVLLPIIDIGHIYIYFAYAPDKHREATLTL